MSESSHAPSGSIPSPGNAVEDSPPLSPESGLVAAGGLGLRRPRETDDGLGDGDVVEADSREADDDLADDADDSGDEESGERRGSGRRRRSWRRGGSSVKRWGWELFGWAVLALGVGTLGSAAATELVGGTLGALLSQLVIWLAFAAPVVLAFARSRPRGLLNFRPVDLLYAVVLGGMLRFAQGWLELRAGGNGAWPSYPSLGGSLPSGYLFEELLTPVVIAPVLEEFFFRGLVLVAVYSAVRRIAGRDVAMFAAAIVSTALFIVAHALVAPLAWDAVVSLALLGLVASLLVLFTGRIWAAVLTHVVYNGIWVALATVGTLLSA
ncbi:CPBP family intramembrane glutamic endopeptidase [Microbacterium sp. P04]|uniref:CPBP family intramembrane glutamic endopeptidase n=1 Tax=Microbacterium sp. P04 TaxID=3366947 RepID=UPI003746DFAB